MLLLDYLHTPLLVSLHSQLHQLRVLCRPLEKSGLHDLVLDRWINAHLRHLFNALGGITHTHGHQLVDDLLICAHVLSALSAVTHGAKIQKIPELVTLG